MPISKVWLSTRKKRKLFCILHLTLACKVLSQKERLVLGADLSVCSTNYRYVHVSLLPEALSSVIVHAVNRFYMMRVNINCARACLAQFDW